MPYKKSEITKELVYKAALELMEEKGYRGATIRDICKRANVSVGTFYCYFNTKSDVIREIYLSGDKFFLEAGRPRAGGQVLPRTARSFVGHYARLNIETASTSSRSYITPTTNGSVRRGPCRAFSSALSAEDRSPASFA